MSSFVRLSIGCRYKLKSLLIKGKQMSEPLKNYRHLFFLVLLAFPYVNAQFSFAELSTPLAIVRDGTERAVNILRSSQKGDAPTLRQRKDEILVTVDEYFDFAEMARRSLGRPWQEQSAERLREFVHLFKQLLFNAYIGQVEKMTGFDEKFFYDSEKLDGNFALVKTHVTVSSGKNENIDYRLRYRDGKWRVYDVVIDGVSMVENYRSQFNSILFNQSFESLLKKLKAKVDQSA